MNFEQFKEDLLNDLTHLIKKQITSALSQLPQSQDQLQQINQQTVQNSQNDQKQIVDYTKSEMISQILVSRETNVSLAKKFNKCEGTVRKLRKEALEEQIEKSKPSKKKKSAQDPQMELKLIEYVNEMRDKGLVVNMKDIQTKAKKLSTNITFRASNGWFDRFCKRWGLTHRTPTNIMQKLTDTVFDQIQEHIKKLQDYRIEQYKEKRTIIFFSIDETSIQYNFGKNKTYDNKGQKEIRVLGVKNPKERITALIMISSEGDIYPPMLIFKGKEDKIILNQYDQQCIIVQNKNAWIDIQLYLLYLQSTIGNLKRDKEKVRFCLLQDKCSVHISAEIGKYLKEKDIDFFTLPAGSTSLIQVLDVVYNKPFKDRFNDKFHVWQESNYANNEIASILQPSKSDIISWVLSSMDEMPLDLIKKGFKVCAVNNNIDGSEEKLVSEKIQKKDYIMDMIRKIFAQNLDVHETELLEMKDVIKSTQNTYETTEQTKVLISKIEQKSVLVQENEVKDILLNSIIAQTLQNQQTQVSESESNSDQNDQIAYEEEDEDDDLEIEEEQEDKNQEKIVAINKKLKITPNENKPKMNSDNEQQSKQVHFFKNIKQDDEQLFEHKLRDLFCKYMASKIKPQPEKKQQQNNKISNYFQKDQKQ